VPSRSALPGDGSDRIQLDALGEIFDQLARRAANSVAQEVSSAGGGAGQQRLLEARAGRPGRGDPAPHPVTPTPPKNTRAPRPRSPSAAGRNAAPDTDSWTISASSQSFSFTRSGSASRASSTRGVERSTSVRQPLARTSATRSR